MTPETYLRGLQSMSAQGQFRAVKEQVFAWLDLRSDERVLDVGCGSGADALAMARTVGPGGRVVGIDSAEAMIAHATDQRAGEARHLPVSYELGDAQAMTFPGASVDAAHAERVFQHLTDPQAALAEMIRVTRPGGRVLVADVDWGMAGLDGSDRELTQRILDHTARAVRQGWIGRRLNGLFRQAELRDVRVAPIGLLFDHYDDGARENWRWTAGRAQDAGAVSATEVLAFLADLEERGHRGTYFSAITMFIAIGYKG